MPLSIWHIRFFYSDVSCLGLQGSGIRNTLLDMDMSHTPIQDDHSSVQLEPEDDKFHHGPNQAAKDASRAISAFFTPF
jgi:hypothetical protein